MAAMIHGLIDDSFRPRPDGRWSRIQVGGGQLVISDSGLRLALLRARRSHYADAQIDDYVGLQRRCFPWRPPLRLTVRARAAERIIGTAGFGFWNHPLSPLGGFPALPAAIWFLYASPPSNMPLAYGAPGHGWKASCIDATRPAALAWLPLAGPVVLLNQLQPLERRIWPAVQRSLQIAEAPVPALGGTGWHTCTIDWQMQGARFAIDGQVVLETDRAPRGPLGFVAWIDNQWLVATPRGLLGWGLLDVDEPQWLDLSLVRIEEGVQ